MNIRWSTSKWDSRKLVVAAGGMLTVVLSNVGLPEDVAQRITDAIVWIACAFLAGQGIVDAAGAHSGKGPAETGMQTG